MTTIASVSVVVPCFRCIETLERAVASVSGQTVLPLELILVDDASGDETRSLMTQLQSSYPFGWIKLVLLDNNQGAASARNAGWDQARGRYVAFLDADDAWHPRKIELQVKYMDLHPSVVISGHGFRQAKIMPDTAVSIDDEEFQNVSLLYVLLKNPFVTPSFMVRRDLEIRFLPGRRYMEDHLFLMRVAATGFGIANARMPLAYIFKPIFGESGLSADLMSMQRSELENYSLMGRSGTIGPVSVKLLQAYSWMKFSRRYILVHARSWLRKRK